MIKLLALLEHLSRSPVWGHHIVDIEHHVTSPPQLTNILSSLELVWIINNARACFINNVTKFINGTLNWVLVFAEIMGWVHLIVSYRAYFTVLTPSFCISGSIGVKLEVAFPVHACVPSPILLALKSLWSVAIRAFCEVTWGAFACGYKPIGLNHPNLVDTHTILACEWLKAISVDLAVGDTSGSLISSRVHDTCPIDDIVHGIEVKRHIGARHALREQGNTLWVRVCMARACVSRGHLWNDPLTTIKHLIIIDIWE